MGALRKPFRGTSNILRFNWHFYALAFGVVATVAAASAWLDGIPRVAGIGVVIAVLGMTLVSLLASWYVYDASGLYRFDWLAGLAIGPGGNMVNIHAGFDETTPLLRTRYPEANWTVMDFYDPAKHTEISIKRARRAYPPSPGDVRVSTSELPISSGSADAVFFLLAAHEIRDQQERQALFREVHRVLGTRGKTIVLEHPRDGLNALAYTVGVFHFISEKDWLASFDKAGLRTVRKVKPNPLMTCFVLEKDGAAS